MSMRLRYRGAFLSRKGHEIRVDILQESDTDFEVGDLTFPAETPVTITWEHADKEQPVCGSSAVITVESPGDRTYMDLYSIKAGRVRADIYRDGNLYWSGTLDPEFYEEPYSRLDKYDVSLTFSDFGILHRLPYDGTGLRTLLSLVTEAALLSKVNYVTVDEGFISTSFEGGAGLELESLSVLSDNFYDEDGIAMEWYEVLESILQPLALRIVQRGGRLWVYDLNALVSAFSQDAGYVEWSGDDSVMGTDPVYNNIKISFSPYASGTLDPGEMEYEGEYGPEWTNTTTDADGAKRYGEDYSGEKPECYSFYPNAGAEGEYIHAGNPDLDSVGFTIFTIWGNHGYKGLAQVGVGNGVFHIVPNMVGSEASGIIGGFKAYDALRLFPPAVLKGQDPGGHNRTVAFRTKRFPVQDLGEEATNYYLHLIQEILVDARYNPFEDLTDRSPLKGDDTDLMEHGNLAFIPVDVVLYSAGGVALKHWTNKDMTRYGHPGDSVRSTLGQWLDGDSSWGEAWLAWYSMEDLVDSTGLRGWQRCRQNFGKIYGKGTDSRRKHYYRENEGGIMVEKQWWYYTSFAKNPEGQYIKYPPCGGYIEIRVYNGVWIYDDKVDSNPFADDGITVSQDIYDTLRWLLYKAPTLEVVSRALTLDKADVEDMEYSGVANVDAKEDLSLETICGTLPVPCPTGKGLYLLSSDGSPIRNLVRNGRTDCPEHLLIGTLYSQYAERHLTLSGEMEIDGQGLTLVKDWAQGGTKVFLVSEEVQDLITDTSQATLTEVTEDQYDGEG